MRTSFVPDAQNPGDLGGVCRAVIVMVRVNGTDDGDDSDDAKEERREGEREGEGEGHGEIEG